jgi:hypothetical protein
VRTKKSKTINSFAMLRAESKRRDILQARTVVYHCTCTYVTYRCVLSYVPVLVKIEQNCCSRAVPTWSILTKSERFSCLFLFCRLCGLPVSLSQEQNATTSSLQSSGASHDAPPQDSTSPQGSTCQDQSWCRCRSYKSLKTEMQVL